MKIIYALLLAALLGACQRATPTAPTTSAVVASAPAAAAADAPRAAYAPPAGRRPTVPELTELGRAMFNDASLSASGKLACASCHSPDNAYSPNNNLAAQLGGADGKTEGTRATP